MLKSFLKNMNPQNQGILAIILGLILILGIFEKLGVLQTILNAIIVFTGLSLLLWGLHSSNIYHRIKEVIHKKNK